uniref:Putative monooxygenase p33MONOX n=1 Tax=Cyprinodon variegatus TaxID=28743 RepID=A0A3Q2DPW8_CYPVA
MGFSKKKQPENDLIFTIEGSGMGGMRLPVGMTRRALSYDDNLEAPMSTPPHDISINNLWRRPIIPERKFSQLEDEGGPSKQAAVQDGAIFKAPAVVKTKASSIIMNSLITSIQKVSDGSSLRSRPPPTHFLADMTLNLLTPETCFLSFILLPKLQIQSLEAREEKSSSAQSTPSNTPHSSPKQQRRYRFSGEHMGGGAVDRWGVFGPRLPVQTGFAIQAYRGAQKPTPMEVMKSQATRLADNPQRVNPPQMEIPTMEGRRQGARPHKLKHRDMNILTPSGF